jgi:hypothetical protein
MHVRAFVPVASCLALGLLAGCREDGELSFPVLPPVAAQTTQSVDLALGPFALWLASVAIPENDPKTAQVKRILQGLKTVKVRSYKLTPGSPLPAAQIAALRSQLTAPVWSQLVQTHDRDKGEDVAVYLAQDAQEVHGIAVLATSRTEVTIVNVVGTIKLEDVAALSRIASEARKDGNIRWQTTDE